MKNRKSLIFLVLIMVVTVSLFFILTRRTENKETEVGKIGDFSISDKILELYLSENEGIVLNQYAKENKLTSYGDDLLKQESAEQKEIINALREKVEAEMLYDYAVLTELEKIDKEKPTQKEHSLKQLNGAYGEIKNQVSDGKDMLMKNINKVNPPSEKDLYQAFNQLDKKYKTKPFEISGVEMNFFNENKMELISFFKQNGTSTVEEIQSQFQAKYSDSVIKEWTLDSQNIQKEDTYQLALAEVLVNKVKGDLIEGLKEGQYFYIISKKGGGELTQQEAPDLAKNKYLNDQLDNKISTRMKTLKFETKEPLVDLMNDYYKNKK
ncbi:hypothetical protein [Vagococcus silagei]|uniref:Uncharacterized protein n=1 Tax=Vagococcus silagei TaxID=2508885 RepID=A0A4S3B653_9ENTE|nr:hypothetical protein [Vagococcus silagei]THB61183.1 hypothetical protein ESZ54_06590 [Vagococcus silagei]